MHFSTFVAAVLLPFAACGSRDPSLPLGGANCPETCYGMTCMGAVALWDGPDLACETAESWGCDCDGCDCTDTLDIDTVEDVPEDYACGAGEGGDRNGFNCDEFAYFGFGCHYMETRRDMDCSGCLCEEAILGYEKGDGICPHTCSGASCDVHTSGWNVFSCEVVESFDWILGCDCSGCETCDSLAQQEGWDDIAYNGMDCNGNGYWSVDYLGDDSCDDDVRSFAYIMGNPTDGYEARTWFVCANCPELDCDMGDCGASCERDGTTCALPLCELCADEDSVVTPTQYGRAQYCTEDSYTCAPSPAPTTAAPTVTATEATVVAEEDGSFALTTTAVFVVALMLA